MRTVNRNSLSTRLMAVLVVCLVGVALVGCSSTQSSSTGGTTVKVKKISKDEALKIIEENPEAIVVDVRTQAEYDEFHLPRAILIPVDTIGNTPPAQLPDKNAKILVYCRSGNRSAVAAQKLVDLGYTDVTDFGGIYA